MEWYSVKAKDYINILQCNNCCGIGHTYKKCEIITTCKYCAGNHNSRECPVEDNYAACILCYIEHEKNPNKNITYKLYCFEKQCPHIQEIKRKIIHSIDYGHE